MPEKERVGPPLLSPASACGESEAKLGAVCVGFEGGLAALVESVEPEAVVPQV